MIQEINWFVVDKNKNDKVIESHKLIYKGNKIIERSYIVLETNEYVRMI
jgi:hypothetical protein